MTSWNSWSFFALLLVLLIIGRLLSGRATLGFSKLMLFFSLGSAGAAIINLVIQRVAIAFASVNTISYTVGPVAEELVKAAPVFLLAYVFSERHRLTLADLVLVGLATGIGFQFVETNLHVLAGAGRPDPLTPWTQPLVIPGGPTYWTAGHALWTAFVGLGVGVGLMLWPRGVLRFVPAIAAFGLSLFEHIMSNWKAIHVQELFGQIQGEQRAPAWAEKLYSVDLHGRLLMIMLPVVLVSAAVTEGLRCRAALNDRVDLMLPDEGLAPWVPREWIALGRTVPSGRAEFVRTARYLRRRRELGYVSAAAREGPGGRLGAQVTFLTELVAHEREELDVPLARRWMPKPGRLAAGGRRVVVGTWTTTVPLVVAFVVFTIGPRTMPHLVRTVVFGRAVAVLLVAMTGALLYVRVRRFRRVVHPRLLRSDGETLVSFHIRGVLLLTSAATLAFAVVALFLSSKTLVPGAGTTFITNALDSWARAGGSVTTLAVAASMVSAGLANPTLPDPCGDLRASVESGAIALAGLAEVAGAGMS